MPYRNKTRVALLSSVIVKNDAISNSIRDKLRALTENSSAAQLYDVTAFTTHSSRLGPHIKLVRSVTEVVLDPVFLSADIHIFEFGVYTELFNAIYCSRPGQTKVVHYHNITPPELVPPEKREITYKSLEQKVNLLAADQIWCVSEINRMDLLEYGIAADKLSLLPLPVSFVHQPPPVRSPERKNRVDLLYVGRLVPSKGILDVLRALCALRQTGPLRASLKLVGSPTFSDQEYISELHSFLAKHDLTGHVQFAGEVSDQELLRCYDEADALVIPSYHEGFCVPVVEAFSRGRCVIAYDAGNLPYTLNGLGITVPTGDIEALTAAIGNFCQGKLAAWENETEPQISAQRGDFLESIYMGLAAEYTKQFRYEAFCDNFLKKMAGLSAVI